MVGAINPTLARPALLLALVATATALAPSGPGRGQDRAAGRRIEPRAAARAAPRGATKRRSVGLGSESDGDRCVSHDPLTPLARLLGGRPRTLPSVPTAYFSKR